MSEDVGDVEYDLEDVEVFLPSRSIVDVESSPDGVDDVFLEHIGDLVGVVAEDEGCDGG